MLNIQESPVAWTTGKAINAPLINGVPVELSSIAEKKAFAFLIKYPNGTFEQYQNTMNWNITENIFDKVRTEMQSAHQLPPTNKPAGSVLQKSGNTIAMANFEKMLRRKRRVTLDPERKMEVIKILRSNPRIKFGDLQAQYPYPELSARYFHNLRHLLGLSRKRADIAAQSKLASSSIPSTKEPQVAVKLTPTGEKIKAAIWKIPVGELRKMMPFQFLEKNPQIDQSTKSAQLFYYYKVKRLKGGSNARQQTRTKTAAPQGPAFGGISIIKEIECSDWTAERKKDMKAILPGILESLYGGGTYRCVEVIDETPILQVLKTS